MPPVVNYVTFAIFPWNRCRAFRTHVDAPEEYWGRCGLIKNHAGDHALQRGTVIVRWSTAITKVQDSSGALLRNWTSKTSPWAKDK